MLLSPARKQVQARTTIQHSPRRPRTTRPAALALSLGRHLHPLSGHIIHHHLKKYRRRLRPSPAAQSTHLPPISPPHPSPIGRAITPTAMPPRLAIHRRHSPQAHAKTVFPLPRTPVTHSLISMDPMPPRPPVEASTKPRRKSRLRPGAKSQRPPTGTAAAGAPSASASQATSPIVPST